MASFEAPLKFQASTSKVSDEAIQYTNTDASNFKAYAVQKGYYQDAYIKYFAKVGTEHKSPEMSRGYYARVHAIKTCVMNFLEKTNSKCQLINIGAGYDTLYFNLKSINKLPLKYIEIDFQQICKSKKNIIKTKKPLMDCLIDVKPNCFDTIGEGDVHSAFYHLISADLRSLNELNTKLNAFEGLDFTIPTLVISECVLIYMKINDSSQLINFFANKFVKSIFLNYEPYNLNDRFGKIMLDNLSQCGCNLVGYEACLNETTQRDRFLTNGYCELVNIMSMTEYYKTRISNNERKRIEMIEFLDEVELLFQLLDHYCICIAYNYKNENFLI